jgi:copper chaperone CopZ
MRRLSLLAVVLCASFLGCKPAVEETLPKVTPKPSTATTEDAAGSAATTEDPGAAPQTPATTTETAAPAGDTPAPAKPDGDGTTATGKGAAVRFVADKKLEVPGMMCPYGCYPTVEKTLVAIPGVKGVQLAEQPAGTKEGEIALKVVEIKVAEGFDLSAALAALKKADFEAAEAN